MATLLTDDFNSYSVGNLNGNGTWVEGEETWKVQTAVTSEGTAAAHNNTNSTGLYARGAGTGVDAGRMSYYVRLDSTSNNLQMHVPHSTDINHDCFMVSMNGEGGAKWQYRDNGGYHNLAATWSANTWYCVEIEWTAGDQYQFRIDGASWNGYYNFYDASTPTYILFYYDNLSTTGNAYFDYIAEYPYGYEPPTTTERSKHNLLLGVS
jgi:hypothetical protein